MCQEKRIGAVASGRATRFFASFVANKTEYRDFMDEPRSPRSPLREQLHEVIFEADTPMGKAFDIILLIFISISVVVETAVCDELPAGWMATC